MKSPVYLRAPQNFDPLFPLCTPLVLFALLAHPQLPVEMMFLPLAALLGALINTGSVNASKRGLGWGDPHTDDDVRDLCSNGKVT